MRNVFFSFLIIFLSVPFLSFASNHDGRSTSDTTGTDRSTTDTSGTGRSTAEGGTSLTNPLDGGGISTIPQFFQAIIDILLVFAIPFIVFFIIYAGFQYVTARGDVGKIQKAHAALLYAIIGGLLILGANVLIAVVTGTVNEFK